MALCLQDDGSDAGWGRDVARAYRAMSLPLDLNAGAVTPTAPDELVSLDDHALMVLIGAGDKAAFAQFCRRHAGRSFAVAQNILKNSADAEEAVQDAFLRVWRHAPRWQVGEARVSSWLFRIVVNLSLDRVRQASRLSQPLEMAAEAVAAGPSPEALVEHRELARAVGRAIAKLPPRQRAALSLVICEGLACSEAAKAMQVTVGTMESLLVRGRRKLREAIAEATGEAAKIAAQESATSSV